ncbi:MAG: hypothetical protein FWE62_00405 [Firmicutes bacterium]|nr:hypothetical protein [Bacillota bacterium]
MDRKPKNEGRTVKILLALVVTALALLMVFDPSRYMNAAKNGMNVFCVSVLPALLPFMFFAKVLTDLNAGAFFEKTLAKPVKKLFRVPGSAAYIFALSALSGYPVGARLIGEVRAKGGLTRAEACRAAAFCTTSGPLFVLGTIGAGFLLSPRAGTCIFAAHILAALVNGFIFARLVKDKKMWNVECGMWNDGQSDNNLPTEGTGNKAQVPGNHSGDNNFTFHIPYSTFTEKNFSIDWIISNAVWSSVVSVLTVGAYITLFFLVIEAAAANHVFYPLEKLAGLFLPDTAAIRGIEFGLIEVTRGIAELAKLKSVSLPLTTSLSCALISFGGLSVHMQSYPYLSAAGVPFWYCLATKTAHTGIAFGLCWVFMAL